MAGFFDEKQSQTAEEIEKERIRILRDKIERKLCSGYDDAHGKLLDAKEKRMKLISDFDNFDVSKIINCNVEILNFEKAKEKIKELCVFMLGVQLPREK